MLESSGKFRTMEALAPYFAAGVRKVVVAAPVKDERALNIVVGVNDDRYDPETHDVVTAASCTTNCLAPVVQVIHEGLGIERGSITTLHDADEHPDRRRCAAQGPATRAGGRPVVDPDDDRLGDRDRPDLPGAAGQVERVGGPGPAVERLAHRLRLRRRPPDDRR